MDTQPDDLVKHVIDAGFPLKAASLIHLFIGGSQLHGASRKDSNLKGKIRCSEKRELISKASSLRAGVHDPLRIEFSLGPNPSWFSRQYYQGVLRSADCKHDTPYLVQVKPQKF